MSEDTHELDGSRDNGPVWEPDTPCQPEVVNVVRFVRDCLRAAGPLEFEYKQEDENPDAWSFIVMDSYGYMNVGIISWNREKQRVAYVALNPDTVKHDEMEGVSEDESKCWWSPTSARMFVMFLTGEVRQAINKDRQIQWREMDRAA